MLLYFIRLGLFFHEKDNGHIFPLKLTVYMWGSSEMRQCPFPALGFYSPMKVHVVVLWNLPLEVQCMKFNSIATNGSLHPFFSNLYGG